MIVTGCEFFYFWGLRPHRQVFFLLLAFVLGERILWPPMRDTVDMDDLENEGFECVEIDGIRYPVDDVIRVLGPHLTERRKTRIQDVLVRRITSLALGVENLHHSHNGSACIRTAEALGLHDIVAAELTNQFPIPPSDEREVSSGITKYSDRWVDLHRVQSSEALIHWARSRKMRVYGTSPHAEMTVSELDVGSPLLVLFGNESEGLKPETAAACDGVFRLPMYGFTESFNISVSVGMTLADIVGRLRSQWAQEGRQGDMPVARQNYLTAQWYAKSVRAAIPILKRTLA